MILIENNDVSCNHTIIQSFPHHEDASLALWALLSPNMQFLLNLLKMCTVSLFSERDDISKNFWWSKRQWEVKKKIRDSWETRPIRPTMRPHDDEMIVWWCDYMKHHYLRSKSSIFPFFTKASPTDRRTDGPTDGRTDRRMDRPSYRDARTHLKMKRIDKNI